MFRALLFITTLALLSVATVELTTKKDPYRIYSEIPAGQPDSTDLFWHLRLHKPYRLERLQPTALVIGSSVTGRLVPGIIFPDHARAYNAAIPGASMLEVEYMLEHALQSGQVKEIVLGLEYFMFVANYQGFIEGFEPSRMRRENPSARDRLAFRWQRLKDWWASSFSRSAIADSLRLDRAQESSNRAFWPDGSWNLERETLPPRAYYRLQAQQKLKEFSSPAQRWDFSSLERIITLAGAHGAELTLLLSPYHAYIHNAIALTGNFGTYLAWQREVSRIAGDAGVPLYALANNRVLVTADIAGQADSFLDGVHYRRGLGLEISRCLELARRAANCAPPLRLTRLDGSNVDEYLRELGRIGTDYAESNPEQIAGIRKLAEKMLAEGPPPDEVTAEPQF